MHEPNEFGVPTHAHSHTEAHSHSHPHVHESKKNVVNRLARAIGHCRGVDSRSRLRTGNRRRLTIKQ